MPSLICDPRPEAALLWDEYRALQAAGESLALFWPAATAPAGRHAPATSPQGLQACFENEQIAFLPRSGLPAWLPVDDFHRVLLIAEREPLPPPERALADFLLAHGAEEVEILPPSAAADLAQSWASGRRTGSTILRS